jgi:hypothetical protein
MIRVFFNGNPAGKAPFFVLKKGGSWFNFLRRIYVGGKIGTITTDYFTIISVHRIAGGICIILWGQHIVACAPWPRLVRDE